MDRRSPPSFRRVTQAIGEGGMPLRRAEPGPCSTGGSLQHSSAWIRSAGWTDRSFPQTISTRSAVGRKVALRVPDCFLGQLDVGREVKRVGILRVHQAPQEEFLCLYSGPRLRPPYPWIFVYRPCAWGQSPGPCLFYRSIGGMESCGWGRKASSRMRDCP